MKVHDDLTFNVIGATMAYYDLTFNVIGATMESPSQNPLACLYKPRVCSNKLELLRCNPCCLWLSLAPRGAGLADSRLTSPRDPLALLREVPLPLCAERPPYHWRREWQPTLVFLPEESHEQRSLADCSPQGHKELDTT